MSFKRYCGNFHEWIQYRKTIIGENREDFDSQKLMEALCQK